MNLQKLFEMQQVLDEHIMNEHPEIRENESNLDWKLLALQVELGECANEWRGFKKWSKNQEPRTHLLVKVDSNGHRETNPLLEEYVDCLHFMLSIGLEEFTYIDFGEKFFGPVNLELTNNIVPVKYQDIAKQFLYLFNSIGYLTDSVLENEMTMSSETFGLYVESIRVFIGLGEMLGFTWEQIEAAYFEKNKINHQRQEAGY